LVKVFLLVKSVGRYSPGKIAQARKLSAALVDLATEGHEIARP
jgi:hypothetical protein